MTICKVKFDDRETEMKIPDREFQVLAVLGEKEMVPRQIVNHSNGKIAINSVYTLLNRLKKRGLVVDRDVARVVFGETFRRVAYRRTFKKITILGLQVGGG